MTRAVFILLVAAMLDVAPLKIQSRRPPARPTPAPAMKRVPADAQCPALLGTGVATGRLFCDVILGRDPADGIVIQVPLHRGSATLSFDLHNRHTYSEEQVRAKRSYAHYTATVGVLTADNTLLARGVIQTEFRTAADLFDRVKGGAGPSGVKAVAPTGTESIVVSLPEDVDQVSIVGEKLTLVRVDGTDSFTSPGRPIAVVSNLAVEYRPAVPARKRSR